MRLMAKSALFLCVVLVCTLMIGCGGGPSIAPVQGNVTCNGEPVTGGTVMFNPIPEDGKVNADARSAMGILDSSGHYVLSTNADGDGALVGKHNVEVIDNAGEEEGGAGLPGALPDGFEVEVTAGDNTIDLELEPK